MSTCEKCGSCDLKEEARNWGSVVICRECGHAKPGYISALAKQTIGDPNEIAAFNRSQKADSLVDAMAFVRGPKREEQPARRREYDPDAEAAAEEADIATWGE